MNDMKKWSWILVVLFLSFPVYAHDKDDEDDSSTPSVQCECHGDVLNVNTTVSAIVQDDDDKVSSCVCIQNSVFKSCSHKSKRFCKRLGITGRCWKCR